MSQNEEIGDRGHMEEVSKKLRGGMNKEQFDGVDKNDDAYFDGDLLDKLNKEKAAAGHVNMDQDIDLMDFISKSDFSTVGGQNNAAAQPQQPKPADEFFDFENAQNSNQNSQKKDGGISNDLLDVFSNAAAQQSN